MDLLDLYCPTLPRPARLPCTAALASLEAALLRDNGREVDGRREGIARTELAVTCRPARAL